MKFFLTKVFPPLLLIVSQETFASLPGSQDDPQTYKKTNFTTMINFSRLGLWSLALKSRFLTLQSHVLLRWGKKCRLVCPVEWNPSNLQDPATQRFLFHAVLIPHKYNANVNLGMGEAIWLHNTLPSGTIVLLMKNHHFFSSPIIYGIQLGDKNGPKEYEIFYSTIIWRTLSEKPR